MPKPKKVTLKTSGMDALVMDKITVLIKSTFHGSVTIVVQDACIIQIERNEKLRLCDLLSGPIGNASKGENDIAYLNQSILESINGLKYGQIVIIIKNGSVVQIEKTEKRRFSEWQGVDGEGI